MRADHIVNFDMSLSKEFKFREGMLLQVRMEMFDVANHQRFAFPDIGSGDGSFGNVTSTAAGISGTNGSFRKMQFGVRFQF